MRRTIVGACAATIASWSRAPRTTRRSSSAGTRDTCTVSTRESSSTWDAEPDPALSRSRQRKPRAAIHITFDATEVLIVQVDVCFSGRGICDLIIGDDNRRIVFGTVRDRHVHEEIALLGRG